MSLSLLVVALLVPLLLLALMLGMEHVERPLRDGRPSPDELATFLDTARPEEVEAYISDGFAPALERYWKRRRLARLLPGRTR